MFKMAAFVIIVNYKYDLGPNSVLLISLCQLEGSQCIFEFYLQNIIPPPDDQQL